ncbi:hypothetical protein NDU88_009511 [Pleurodeles waltl]|uniref:Uncharacterized protein n=1 Tax=Pleurodeles waltl TaxID=8319 RepID=A0AAV7RVF4_PLEWA|nr:hypothetical protein NDU88_009511 [Pleurodeles waltl]
MCRCEFQEVLRPREPRGGSSNGFSTQGALWWNRAVLDLRRSGGLWHRPPSVVKQAEAEPAQVKADLALICLRLRQEGVRR